MKKINILLLLISVVSFTSCAPQNSSSTQNSNSISSSVIGNIASSSTSVDQPVSSPTSQLDSSSSNSSSPSTTVEPKEEGFLIYSIEMMGRYGDSNLIKYGDYDILIDGGTSSDANYVKKALEKHVTDHVLDLLVVSHPDADHIDGLENSSVYSSIDDIGLIVENGDTRGNSDFEDLVSRLYPNTPIKMVTELIDDPILVDDEFRITFLNQSNYYSSSASKNNKSIGLTINYKNTLVFMGGDMESSACSSIMQNYPNLTTEDQFVVFKGLHHGSKGTNKENFLTYLKPDFCFVTAGMQLSEPSYRPNFGSHPYLEAMVRMGEETPEVYWSGINGNLSIYCDGESATISGEGRSRDYYYMPNGATDKVLVDREAEKDVTFFESKWYLEAMLYYPNVECPNFAGVDLGY